MNVEYIAVSALEKITAVATIPVPTNWTYSSPSTLSTTVAPSPSPNARRYTTGSTTLENVLDFQNDRKFATSRLITPAMAAGSSLRGPTCACASPPARSLPPPPRQQHEHVLQRRRPAHRVLRHRAVGRPLRAHDRD